MKFLSMIRIDEKTGQRPTDRLIADMEKLLEEMTREGSLVTTSGLRPTSEGVRLRSNYGKLSRTDGPFTETKEVIGGFAMLEAKSMEEAVELAKRFIAIHRDEWNFECEIRQMEGAEIGKCGT